MSLLDDEAVQERLRAQQERTTQLLHTAYKVGFGIFLGFVIARMFK